MRMAVPYDFLTKWSDDLSSIKKAERPDAESAADQGEWTGC